MRPYPAPSPDEPWPPDVLEDWLSAHSDDERRRILLEFGYDVRHQPDAERLFCASAQRTAQYPKQHQPQGQSDKRKLKRILAAIAAAIGAVSAIIGLLADWPAAWDTLRAMVESLLALLK